MGAKVGTRPVGLPVFGWRFVDRGKQLRQRDQHHRDIGVVGWCKLTEPRQIDPDRGRGVYGQRVFIANGMGLRAVKKRMYRREFQRPTSPLVVVLVQRCTHQVERQCQHQQPAREPPRAAHVAGAKA